MGNRWEDFKVRRRKRNFGSMGIGTGLQEEADRKHLGKLNTRISSYNKQINEMQAKSALASKMGDFKAPSGIPQKKQIAEKKDWKDNSKTLSQKRLEQKGGTTPSDNSSGDDSRINDIASKIGSKQMENSSSGLGTAGGALMMTGNPYAMAAGAGLSVIGKVKAKKEADKARRINKTLEGLAMMQNAFSVNGAIG